MTDLMAGLGESVSAESEDEEEDLPKDEHPKVQNLSAHNQSQTLENLKVEIDQQGIFIYECSNCPRIINYAVQTCQCGAKNDFYKPEYSLSDKTLLEATKKLDEYNELNLRLQN